MHRFASSVEDIPFPSGFTYPFHYTPHPLVQTAAHEVRAYLRTRPEWEEELKKGKMFGVLLIEDTEGYVGYLAAFSGNLDGSNLHRGFVPPVYDLLCPDGFFKQEESEISAINRRIELLETDEDYLHLQRTYQIGAEARRTILAKAKEEMKRAKLLREEKRKKGISPEEEAQLIKESQFQKAEYKRLEKRLKLQGEELKASLSVFENQIQILKHERKIRSAALQQKLFEQFRMLNAQGEEKDLCQIFHETPQGTPPAGAGECALPKLLQYAYQHNFHPLAMGEFWIGESPKEEIRHEGHFYPSCKNKCEPILKHMLIGLQVEPNPLAGRETKKKELEIVYEDEWLIVVNKPEGMLSTPGKLTTDSVYTRLHTLYPTATGPLIVHRLDMATSGLLLVAKTKEIHYALQKMFASRRIQKRYTAWLNGIVTTDEGIINLPICPDYDNRPYQMVHSEYGKPAVTRYKVLGRKDGKTHIAFYPLTGRTHQLRVHAAHPDGLNCPIIGDELYGKKADRLYLHASELSFEHPATGQLITFCKEAEF
ncbi:RNA pseudouridine synthase [Bacteroides gallinaceum]|nr:RNA pseudouridine synthase [Bacteroides gallinaceum]